MDSMQGDTETGVSLKGIYDKNTFANIEPGVKITSRKGESINGKKTGR